MAHNFKILDGTMYISKSGHDSNDGSIESPKRSFNDTSVPGGVDLVVGAGHYIGGSVVGSNKTFRIRGDGKVILDSITWSESAYMPNTGLQLNTNIEFRNMNITARQTNIGGFIAKNCAIRPYVSDIGLVKTICIGCELFYISGEFVRLNQSILIGIYGTTNTIKDSYVDKSTILTFLGGFAGLGNSNMRGVLKLLMTDATYKSFTVQDQMVGTPQDNGYATDVYWLNEDNLTLLGYNGVIVGWDASVSGCMNREPLFNNEALEDYTLQGGSPHIGASSSGGNIGGTELAFSVVNTDLSENLEIIPSPEIDTTNINSYTLKPGFTEGFIDYIQKIGSSPLTLGKISPITLLNFNSDFDGGSLENNNVPDSEPYTSNYPRKLTTTTNATDAQTLMISGHNIQIGEFVRVNGEDREVISTTTSTVRVNSIFRGIILAGTEVQVGSEIGLGALKPNRLTYQLRTSKKETKPTLLSDWDNDSDPLYNVGGKFLTQEWDEIPGFLIDTNTNTLYGAGDSKAPRGLPLNEVACRWVNLRVYLRNNYDN